MNEMDQQKALTMMSLNPDANKDEISKRYGIITRKFRTIKKEDENGYTIEDYTEAYNLLMGITFVDEKEEQRQKELRENPPLLAKILKKDPIKLENFIHYNKWFFIGGLALIIIIILSIRSCVNQVHPDFSMALTGSVYAEESEPLEAVIMEKLPELTAPQVHLLTANPNDGEYNYAIMMKQMAMITAAEIDIMLMDQDTFDLMSHQNILLPFEDHMDILPFTQEEYVMGAIIVDEPIDAEPVMGPQMAYAIDITESNFVKDNNIFGEKIYAGIVLNSKRMDKALELLSKLN
ncbi:MAG: hypothetical protein GX115_13475 [Ruminiclostridium sp.]|nr:hypothetical protein [Ruminiclostridium sp.]